MRNGAIPRVFLLARVRLSCSRLTHQSTLSTPAPWIGYDEPTARRWLKTPLLTQWKNLSALGRVGSHFGEGNPALSAFRGLERTQAHLWPSFYGHPETHAKPQSYKGHKKPLAASRERFFLPNTKFAGSILPVIRWFAGELWIYGCSRGKPGWVAHNPCYRTLPNSSGLAITFDQGAGVRA
jgi:hypothetical protein